jgi:hypothetical protein
METRTETILGLGLMQRLARWQRTREVARQRLRRGWTDLQVETRTETLTAVPRAGLEWSRGLRLGPRAVARVEQAASTTCTRWTPPELRGPTSQRSRWGRRHRHGTRAGSRRTTAGGSTSLVDTTTQVMGGESLSDYQLPTGARLTARIRDSDAHVHAQSQTENRSAPAVLPSRTAQARASGLAVHADWDGGSTRRDGGGGTQTQEEGQAPSTTSSGSIPLAPTGRICPMASSPVLRRRPATPSGSRSPAAGSSSSAARRSQVAQTRKEIQMKTRR